MFNKLTDMHVHHLEAVSISGRLISSFIQMIEMYLVHCSVGSIPVDQAVPLGVWVPVRSEVHHVSCLPWGWVAGASGVTFYSSVDHQYSQTVEEAALVLQGSASLGKQPFRFSRLAEQQF